MNPWCVSHAPVSLTSFNGGEKEVMGMVRCPVCESARVVVVLSPTRRAFCVRCGSRWIQEGSVQRSISYARRGAPAPTGTAGP